MIEVRALTKKYGDRLAIDHLNFSIQKGEVVGFLGPNGAGKSTTMKIITGYMAPSEGEVKVAGFDVFEDPIEVKKRIGYLPETPPVYGDMVVQDYLAYVARLKRVPRSEIKQHVEMALEQVHLKEVRGRLIQNLSKGFRQRVGIAQALVSRPEILILDEPTVGLDPRQVQEIRRLIQDLKGKHTIILSTHILPEVQATCERIIIINQGRIVAEDTLSGLASRPGQRRRVSLRVRRNIEGVLGDLKSIPGVIAVSAEAHQIFIDTDGSEDVTERISSQVVMKECGLLDLRAEGLNLEDVFIELTGQGGN